MRRRPGTLFPLEFDILDVGLALQDEDDTFYGFSLARRLSDTEHALTAHGTLYKALSRMTQAGLLQASWEDHALAEADGRPRRRLYRVTGGGELARDRERARLLVEQRAAKTCAADGRAVEVGLA
ncbi:PadR family transcriptional regulator [Plantibacter sp. Mn2098]|uniref:PadR family transcriptional regulator n=1 Tax=Plantibacter sp. Mn2098 TaxID=3395266 RepID=UPI003BE4B493